MMNVVLISGLTVLVVSFILFTMALGGVLYQHVVEFRHAGPVLPEPDNFGRFFKLLMPASFAGLVLATILLWGIVGEARFWLLMAITGMMLVSGFTNRYFVPLHIALFDKQTLPSQKDVLINNWRRANRYRMGLMLLIIICWVAGYSLLLTNAL